ncbi:MAG: flagellar biosynthesis protein FlhB [Rhodoblastus sp.]|nr:MAG: flagellar biosynthesis protein FlhB [Rhodoblastus sp.]
MSEAPDREDKTEDPTERKIEDSLAKGEAPTSREAIAAAGLLGVWICVTSSAPALAPAFDAGLAARFEGVDQIRLRSGEDAATLLLGALGEIALPILWLAAPIAGLSLFAALAQARPRVVADRIAPKWSRVSPAAGWSRLFGGKAMKHAGLVALRLTIAVAALVYVGATGMGAILDALARGPETLPALTLAESGRALWALVVVAGVAGAADFVIAHRNWRADMRMTKQEVKEEARQSEGDPHVRGRLRSLRMRRARNRMIAQVPRATLVVANPTHYAVALRYVRGETAAPMVLAKGVDHMALKIRTMAEEAKIPVIEDRALARSLHKAAVVERMIPPEFYPAVAALIHTLGEATRTRAAPRISTQGARA